ncbi:MAG TPA: glycosyltransferase family 1 protein, partial [Bacteroidetes bacterium]|nr:glycosyltransferase family 1 protein [Bacteroidota bacterium]
MRIGFDAKRLFLNYTGLGNYSRTLVSNLQRFYPQHEYHLYTTKTTRNKDTEEFFDTSKYTIHECHYSLKSYWRSYSIVENLKNDGIDIYHGLSAEIPFGIDKSGIKTVVTIHDLIFKFFKKDYTLIDRMLYNMKTKYACNHADKIIAISKRTKDDILSIYGID